MFKKILGLTSAILLATTIQIQTTGEAQTIDKSDTLNSIDLFSEKNLDRYADVKPIEGGLLEVTPHNPEEFADLAGYEKPSEDAVLDKVYIQNPDSESIDNETTNSIKVESQDSLITPYSITPEYYVVKKGTSIGTGDKIATASNTCYSTVCKTLTASINQTESREAGFSASVELGNDIVSAGVGFNVSESVSVNIGGSYTEENVPYNGRIYLQAYERLKIVGFEIWEDDVFYDDYVGSGSAWQPVRNEVQFASWKTW